MSGKMSMGEALAKGYPVVFTKKDKSKPEVFCPRGKEAEAFNTLVKMGIVDRIEDATPGLGATGEFPDGKLNDNDEGGLKLAVGLDPEKKLVVVDFGKPVAWLGLPKENARAIGQALLDKAQEL